jgi:DNA-binding beta-propeller fold protein YncE
MKLHLPSALLLLSSIAAGQTFQVTQIPQLAADLAWDPVSGRIFVSVTSADAIVPVHTLSQQVGAPIPTADGPRKLAMSSDGQFLYVGFDSTPVVQRVHVPSLAVDLTLQLGSDPTFGANFVEDLTVNPADSRMFAVSRKRIGFSPRHAGVAVFDDGVQLPNTTPSHTGANVIEWSDDPARIYGYNNETTEFGLRTLFVDAQGVQVTQSLNTQIIGFGVDIEYESGLVYSTTGFAVNPVLGQTVGIFQGVGSNAKVAVHAAGNRIHFLSSNTVRTYDLSTFQLVGTQLISGIQGTPARLIAWGQSSLAFSTTGGQLFLLTGNESCTSSWSTYCPALPNSAGSPSQIAVSGNLRIALSDTTLHCSALPAGKWGTFLMSSQRSNLPLGDGRLCVSPFGGLTRIGEPARSDSNGEVSVSLPFQLHPQIGPGVAWHFQFWHRDSSPAGLNLSNAATVWFCP